MPNNSELKAYSYNGLDEPIIAHCFAVEELETVYDTTSYRFIHTINGEKSYCTVSISHDQVMSVISVEALVENAVMEVLDRFVIGDDYLKDARMGIEFYLELKRFFKNRLLTLLSKRFPEVQVGKGTVEA